MTLKKSASFLFFFSNSLLKDILVNKWLLFSTKRNDEVKTDDGLTDISGLVTRTCLKSVRTF